MSDVQQEVIEAAKLYRVTLGRNARGELILHGGKLEDVVEFYQNYRSEIEDVI